MKSKKIILSVILIIFLNELIAQTTTITYIRKPNIEYQLRNTTDEITRETVTKHLLSNTKNFKLTHSNGVSIYKETPTINDNNTSIRDLGSENIYYKNKKENLFLREASFDGTNYLIKEDLINYNWEISNENKKIAGYNCVKATVIINDEIISAWFTDKLVINDGPTESWIKNGLILELNTNNFTISATEIIKIKKNTIINKPTKGKIITLKKYQKIVSDYKMSLIPFQVKN